MFLSSVSIGIVSVLAFCVYKYLTLNFNYWKEKGLVYKKPVLVFGSYYDFILLRASASQIFARLYKQYPSEQLVGSYKGRELELVVRDPDIIQQVLVKDFSVFNERSNEVTSHQDGLNTNLFRVRGERWRAMRQKFTPAFTSIKLKNMFHLIVEKGEEFQLFLEKSIQNKEEHEVRELMARFTTDVISSCAFGVETNSIADSNALFRTMGKKIFAPSISKTIKTFLASASPTIIKLFKLNVLGEDVENFFLTTMKEIVDERQKSKVRRHDFVDILLDLKEKKYLKHDGKEDIEFTDTFMAAQAFIFFAAGFETSSSLMAFVLYELAKHPDVQDKVLLEIDSVLKKHDGKVSYDAISEMQYLEWVLSEGMRMYPALGVLTRVCNKQYTIPGTKITIDKDCSIVIPVGGLHYDPKYYPEPKKFIPERFSPEEKQKRHPSVYLPFGDGPRNCIGKQITFIF